MKILYIVPALLAVAAILAMRLYPRTVPIEECSDVYKRYCAAEGVEAAYVKDFRVNDTVELDVTFLEAATDSAWRMLRKDFGIEDMPPEYAEFDKGADEHTIEFWRAPKANPYSIAKRPRPNNVFVAVSRHKRQICIFHTLSEEQLSAVLTYQFNKISPNTPKI